MTDREITSVNIQTIASIEEFGTLITSSAAEEVITKYQSLAYIVVYWKTKNGNERVETVKNIEDLKYWTELKLKLNVDPQTSRFTIIEFSAHKIHLN